MILQKLKTETKIQHEELERVVNIMDQMFNMDDYRSLLGRFYRYYRSFEKKLPVARLKAVGFDYEPRHKLPALASDLENLGVADHSNIYHAFDAVPDISTESKAFGSLYVVEGSTLGGQVITRHLKQHLDITSENGGAFFNSYGPNVGPMWKQFGESVTKFSEDRDSDDEIIQSARDTFESFRICLTGQR